MTPEEKGLIEALDEYISRGPCCPVPGSPFITVVEAHSRWKRKQKSANYAVEEQGGRVTVFRNDNSQTLCETHTHYVPGIGSMHERRVDAIRTAEIIATALNNQDKHRELVEACRVWRKTIPGAEHVFSDQFKSILAAIDALED